MTAVLIVANDQARRARLERALAGASLFVATSDAEALDLAHHVDVVVRDCATDNRGLPEFLAALRRAAPHVGTITVGAVDADVDADAVLSADFAHRDLERALRHAADKCRLLRELASLRARVGTAAATAPAEPPPDSDGLARVLKAVTRVFAAGFDLPRALDIFLEAIAELVRPSRIALLLPEDGVFRVRAHRGLARPIVESVRLEPQAGLVAWLRLQGRPARLPDAEPDVARDLMLLQGVVAVPLLAQGDLIGVLTLGHPVVRPAYALHEIETLFDLTTHLATTIRNITLHHQLASQKEFSERILVHMSSGVVSIGRDEKVGTMNRRAEEILGLSAAEVMGQDLRALPSPLGDMLFETLSSGRSRPRSEIHLALGGRSLEVSTYPVFGEASAPLGAVLVFEDLTAQKELAAEKRQAEEFQFLTRVVARIADEIKNPLVSIHTFVELIDERFDDPDFRKDFGTVVRRDAQRVVQVFEKLVGLVSERALNFTTVDVRGVVEDLVTAIQAGDDGAGPALELDAPRDSGPYRVKVDVPEFRKAVSYLIWYLAHHSATTPSKVTIAVARGVEDAPGSIRVLVGSRTAAVPPDTLHRLFDPVRMVQESLIDVGPAVSQRIVEALGGRLRLRQTRHELAFMVTLPAEP